MGQTKPIPKGHHTVTPHLVLRDCAKAIQFYQRAFGAKELTRMPGPDGHGVWHAELQIGNSVIYVADEMPGSPHAPSLAEPAATSIVLYVEDCDATFARAIKAGGQTTRKLEDMFWGDRMGTVTDPFGYQWSVATHVRDLSRKEMEKAVAEAHRAAAPSTETATFRRAEAEERDLQA
jgi:uncharacterized glyoxalase superfamily protein PhnB